MSDISLSEQSAHSLSEQSLKRWKELYNYMLYRINSSNIVSTFSQSENALTRCKELNTQGIT